MADHQLPALFNQQDRLAADECVTTARNRTNESLMQYRMWRSDGGNSDASCDATLRRDRGIADFSVKHPNIRFKNGVGVVSPCLVDTDTDLRLNQIWNREKAKTQLFNRFYTAHPNLAKGRQDVEKEDRLVLGESTAYGKQCGKGAAADRFMPLLPCLAQQLNDPDTMVAPFNTFGEDSRQLMRDKQPSFTRCEVRAACAAFGGV